MATKKTAKNKPVKRKAPAKKKVRYDVISPDGFAIHFSDTYPSKVAANKALARWAKGFERQGYYSSNRGRIALSQLKSRCKIVKI